MYYKEYESPMKWYQMKYPAHWELEIIENIPAFYDPEGAGAVQISAFANRGSHYSLSDEMKRYLHQHSIDYHPDKIACFQTVDGTNIETCEFVRDGRFWMVYMLASEDKLILCTYNSDEAPNARDAGIIGSIARSIQFLKET